MAPEKLQKTNPKIRFGLLKNAEDKLVAQLKEKEKEVRLLLAEIQATHNLIEEASDEIEEEEQEKLEEDHKKLEESIEALEEVLEQTAIETSRGKEGNQPDEPLYNTLTAQKLTIATETTTFNRLYELADTTKWTQEDAKEFFEIRDAVTQARQYSFNPLVQETVDNTYKVLQLVTEKKEPQIQANYNPGAASSNQGLEAITKPTSFDSNFQPSEQYKSPSSFDQSFQKPIDLQNNSFSPDKQYKPQETLDQKFEIKKGKLTKSFN